MKKLFLLVLAGASLLSANKMEASNVVGSEISWQCIGQDSFLMTLVVYTDCNGTSLSSASLKFKCATSGATFSTVNMTPGTPIDITPTCNTSCTRCQSSGCSFPYGFRKYSMQQLVQLNGAGTCCNVLISFENCCRSSSINTGGGGANFYTEAMLNRCQNPGNNSPVFTTPPILINCVGQDFTYNTGTVDQDLSANGKTDSITYEWAEPLNASGSPIPYTGSYAYNRPIYFWGFPNDALPFPRGIHLDAKTGVIEYRPMKAEVTLMAVRMSEYRNQVKIAEIRRDMQVLVINCTNNNPPIITTQNNIWEITKKAGDTININFNTSDPNANDTITINWNNSIPGATWTDNNKAVKHPTGTFTWITDTSIINPNPFVLTVTAKDNACPVSASYSKAFRINLIHYNYVNHYLNVSKANIGCGLYNFSIQSPNPTVTYNWVGENFTFDQTTGNTINHNFRHPGFYRYCIEFKQNNIYYRYRDSITIPVFPYTILPNDTTIYNCDTLHIKPYIYKTANTSYLWSTGSTKDQITLSPQKTDMMLKFTVQDSNCSYTDTMIVKRKMYQVYFDNKDTNLCYGYAVNLQPKIFADKKNRYLKWSTGDTNITLYTGFLYKDTIFSLTATDSALCTSTDSYQIKIVSADLLPKEKWVCKGESTSIYPDYRCLTGIKTVNWSNGATSSSINPGPFNTDTTFSVIVTDLNNVMYYDTIQIKIHSPIAILPDDTAVCYGAYLLLKAETKNTRGYISYLWSNGNTSQSAYFGPLKGISPIILKITDYYAIDGINCTDYDTMNYSLIPLPTANLHYTGQPVFCDNDSFILTADFYPNYKYVWYEGNNFTGVYGIRYAVKKAGNYSFKVQDQKGCINSSSTLTVNTLNSHFNVEFVGSPRYFTQPPFIVSFDNLTPNKADYTFTWNFGDGIGSNAANPFHTYQDTGLFDVSLKAVSLLNGCKDLYTKTEYVYCSGKTVGFNDQNTSGIDPKIYPNPANDFLNIEFSYKPGVNCELIMYNATGQVIYMQFLKDKISSVDLREFLSGIYLIKIISGNEHYQKVILKE